MQLAGEQNPHPSGKDHPEGWGNELSDLEKSLEFTSPD